MSISGRRSDAAGRCDSQADRTGQAHELPLARPLSNRHLTQVKTASVQQVPQKWSQILEWVAAGEEVQVTEQERVIARVVPAVQPDFLTRATKIWGDQPPGKPLSELVAEGRGGKS